jgi:hypothetical protein
MKEGKKEGRKMEGRKMKEGRKEGRKMKEGRKEDGEKNESERKEDLDLVARGGGEVLVLLSGRQAESLPFRSAFEAVAQLVKNVEVALPFLAPSGNAGLFQEVVGDVGANGRPFGRKHDGRKCNGGGGYNGTKYNARKEMQRNEMQRKKI